MRMRLPYVFVCSSSKLQVLTFGLRYEASILNLDPIGPSIAQPTCKPIPSLTWYLGITDYTG